MKVLWTEQAFDRLAEIETYIAGDNPEIAQRLVARLIQPANQLAKTPQMGRWYRIVYRVHRERFRS